MCQVSPGLAAVGATAWRIQHQTCAPVADTLAGDQDATLGQDELDVAQTEAEHVIQPTGVADDLTRKAMTAIQGRLSWSCRDSLSSPLIKPAHH